MIRKKLLLIVASSLVTSNQTMPFDFGNVRGSISWQSRTMLDDLGKVGLCLGAAGLATYGLVKIGQWLFSQTNEQCLAKTREGYEQAINEYTALLSILAEKYQGCTDINSCLYDVSEQTLYKLALLICPQVPSGYYLPVSGYIKKLRNTVDQLAYLERNLSSRLHELTMHNGYDPAVIYLKPQMIVVLEQTQGLLRDLHFAYDYVDHHKSYFQLFEREFLLLARYDRELHAIELYGAHYPSIAESMHQAIMVYQREHRDLYPYYQYLLRLEEDINALTGVMQHVSYNYYYRLQAAGLLRNKLTIMRQWVVSSPVYSQELQAYEYARMAAEALATQRENNRLLEAQTCALQEQARAAQQVADELRYEREIQEQANCLSVL